jgi:ribosome biogenesis protein SSF1/2
MQVSPIVGELVRDIRKLMGPYTANNLREKRRVLTIGLICILSYERCAPLLHSYNRMKDYGAVAGQLGITHLVVISQTQNNVIMRLGRVPDGPTLHFRVNQYSLCRQIRATQRRPYDSPAACKHPCSLLTSYFICR